MTGLELKLNRVRAGLTLWQLGKLVDMRPERISEMEHGQRAIAEVVVVALGEVLATVPPMAGSEEPGA